MLPAVSLLPESLGGLPCMRGLWLVHVRPVSMCVQERAQTQPLSTSSLVQLLSWLPLPRIVRPWSVSRVRPASSAHQGLLSCARLQDCHAGRLRGPCSAKKDATSQAPDRPLLCGARASPKGVPSQRERAFCRNHMHSQGPEAAAQGNSDSVGAP